MSVKVKVKIDKSLVKQVVGSGSRLATFKALDHLANVSKQHVDVAADGSSGTVSYDTPYAVIQHESMGFNHQRGRKAKYLEDPCNDAGVQQEMLMLAKQGFSTKME